jgi:heparosan-N-sulfate-glucuronate 5-epimerase
MRRLYRLPSADLAQPYYIVWDLARYASENIDAEGVWSACGTYNPVSIAQYGLYCYGEYVAGHCELRQTCLRQAQFLRRCQRPDGTFAYWDTRVKYAVRAPWISAMAQGEAASLFLRAYCLTSERSYLDAALLAAESLKTDVAASGVSFVRGNAIFFEEIASQTPVHILNGHLYAAFGLWELCRFGFSDPELQRVHERAVQTLVRWLPLFDAKGWTYYQLAINARGARYYAPMNYHQYHIAQMYVFEAMTGAKVFGEYARRWHAGLGDPGLRRRVWLDAVRFFTDASHRQLTRSLDAWRPMPVPTE